MPKKLIILTVMALGCCVLGKAADAAFVKDDTLRPKDAEPSVRAVIEDVTDGDLRLDGIEGIHHPRTIGKASGQANTVTIYARVSGELPSRLPGQPPVEFDEDLLLFSCDQLEDGRWICSSVFLISLVGVITTTEFFFLEK